MQLGLYYDELARKNWQERSRQGEEGFDVNQAAMSFNDEIRRAAEDAFDRDEKTPAEPRRPRTPPKYGGKGDSGKGSGADTAGQKRPHWPDNNWHQWGDAANKRGRRGGATSGATYQY